MSANSSICRKSTARVNDSNASGRTLVMNPGLLPVEWIDDWPVAQAASTRSRRFGSILAGRATSSRVVTMLTPDARRRQTSSVLKPCCMYNTQSAPSASTSSIELVAITPVVPLPHRSPASRPALSGECTNRPTSSRCGWSITAPSDLVPIFPVAHWTTRNRVDSVGADSASGVMFLRSGKAENLFGDDVALNL